MRILIVDDADDVRLLVGEVLRGAGHEVLEASDGRGALHALVTDGRVDVVVLDVQMPDMTGWEVLRAIRFDHHVRDVPVVMCTVASGVPDREAAWRLEADGYVTKPFAPAEILDAVARVAADGERRDRGTG